MTDEIDYLESEFVFVDTEAYVRERFDWASKSFSRIEDLAKKRQIKVLTTSITKREVRNKISEALGHTRSALKKHEVIIEQLEISTTNADGGADERLLNQFDEFLKNVRATEVPLTNNLEKLFSDYFQRLPPFSDGKKSEFPDAAVVDALRAFASLKKKKIYVVSGDPDLKGCCTKESNLIHAPSLNEIISRATVTRQFHEDLLGFATNDFGLKDDIRTQLRAARVSFYGLGRFEAEIEVEGSIDGVDDFKITALNVISREPDRTLFCEIEFEVSLSLSLQFAAGRYEDTDTEEAWVFLSAEATFEFDPDAPEEFTYLSVVAPDSVEVDATELHALRKFR
jgi:PIN domain